MNFLGDSHYLFRSTNMSRKGSRPESSSSQWNFWHPQFYLGDPWRQPGFLLLGCKSNRQCSRRKLSGRTKRSQGPTFHGNHSQICSGYRKWCAHRGSVHLLLSDTAKIEVFLKQNSNNHARPCTSVAIRSQSFASTRRAALHACTARAAGTQVKRETTSKDTISSLSFTVRGCTLSIKSCELRINVGPLPTSWAHTW